MNKLKTAVIGFGGIVQIMHLPHLLKMKDAEISVVCDIDFGKAKNRCIMMRDAEKIRSAVISRDSLRFINIKL